MKILWKFAKTSHGRQIVEVFLSFLVSILRPSALNSNFESFKSRKLFLDREDFGRIIHAAITPFRKYLNKIHSKDNECLLIALNANLALPPLKSNLMTM